MPRRVGRWAVPKAGALASRPAAPTHVRKNLMDVASTVSEDGRVTTFFTADTHFGHVKLLRTRPAFATIEDHDETIVSRWNARVRPDDTVWHLGDVVHGPSRERCAELFARLHGRKRLVAGNHDTNRVLQLPWDGPVVESERLTLVDGNGREHRLYLAHYAHRAWPGVWRGVRHLYGHTHASLPGTTQSCDVGVDAWDFTPASLEEVVARQDATAEKPEEVVRWEARKVVTAPSTQEANERVGAAATSV